MNSAVLECSMSTPAVQHYTSALIDSIPTNSSVSNVMFNGARNTRLFASLLVSALGTSTAASMPFQVDSCSTFGQVWPVNASTLYVLDPQPPTDISVDLSAEERMVLRQAIWDSVEVVSQGRLVEL